VSNPEHLHRALAALAPTKQSSPPFYNDEAPSDATAPWLVGSLTMPDPKPNFAGGSHGGTARWWITVAAETAAAARVHAAAAIGAWSGARISVDGYVLGAVVHRYVNGPFRAGMTVTDTNLRFQVVRLGFDLTVSQIPA
jgi:hypothetical protein